MMTERDVQRVRDLGALSSCGGFHAGGAGLPAAPAWGQLHERFGGVLLRISSTEDIAAGYPGGFLFLSSAPGDWQGAAAALTSDLARLGAAIVAPDLIQDRLSGDRCEIGLAELARWRRSIRDAASGVVVMAGPGCEKSLIVWHDVCAALSSNRPVWVWSGW